MFKPFIWAKPERVKLRALTAVPRLAEVLPLTRLNKFLPTAGNARACRRPLSVPAASGCRRTRRRR